MTRPEGEPGFATESYLRAKAVWRGVRPKRRRHSADAPSGESSAFGKGRDPRLLGAVLGAITEDWGWKGDLEQARLLGEWGEFIGSRAAAHTRVLGVRDGVLEIQCDSTAWATELRRLRGEVLTRLITAYPDSEITDLRFLAPGAPTWRHGPRSVPGRGPRDTYG